MMKVAKGFLSGLIFISSMAFADTGMPKEATIYLNGATTAKVTIDEIKKSEFTRVIECHNREDGDLIELGRVGDPIKVTIGNVRYDITGVYLRGDSDCGWGNNPKLMLIHIVDPVLERTGTISLKWNDDEPSIQLVAVALDDRGRRKHLEAEDYRLFGLTTY